jgi:hypothetical protein
MMAGLLSGLVGDDTVKDEYGMTEADRRAPLFAGLIRSGLLAVAAGGNIMPEQRGQLLAQAGGAFADIPQQMAAERQAAMQNILRKQEVAKSQQQLQDTQKIRDYVNTPEFQQFIQSLPPEMRVPLMGQALKGDFTGIEKARESMAPKVQSGPYGSTTITYPDKSVAQIDAGGTKARWLYRSPNSTLPDEPPGLQKTGEGPGVFDASQPNVGGVDRLDLRPLQGVPHDLAVRVLRVARGEEKMPSLKSDLNGQQIQSLVAQVAGGSGTTYDTRQNFEKSLSGERGIVSTVSRATQHENTAVDLYNAIGNQDGGAGQKYLNIARNQWNSIGNPDLVQKLTAARVALVNAITEAKNAIAGARGTGVVEREEIEKSIDPNMSIAQMKGLMQAVHSQMMEALTSVTYRASQHRHTEVTPENLVGPDVWKQHQNVEKFFTTPSGPSAPQNYVGPDGKPVSAQDIADTAKAENITPDQVIRKYGLKPGGK